MQFVESVRRYKEEGEPDAVRHAVQACIQENVLAEYLQERGSEVANMLIGEYSYEEDIEVQREEAYEEGLEQGLEQGLEEGLEEGRKQGIQSLLEVCKEFHSERSDALRKLVDKFSITKEEAEKYMKMYW